MKQGIKKYLPLFLIMCAVLLITIPASAETVKKSVWYTSKGYYYYYDKTGTKVTGNKKLAGKHYYFDSQGRQYTGWVSYGGNYYYYIIAKGKAAHRSVSRTIDGIEIGANGKAIVTKSNKEKLRLLVAANKIVHEKTNWTMTRDERLRAVFEYMVNGIKYRNIGGFRKTSGWPEYYAAYMFDKKYGDCYSAGCAFAYLATAVGYNKVYAVSSGGHGWCMIDDAVYDPNWARMTGKTWRYYHFTRNISRTKNDPNYFPNARYKIRIDR